MLEAVPHVSSKLLRLITAWPSARDFSKRKWEETGRKNQGHSFVAYFCHVLLKTYTRDDTELNQMLNSDNKIHRYNDRAGV